LLSREKSVGQSKRDANHATPRYSYLPQWTEKRWELLRRTKASLINQDVWIARLRYFTSVILDVTDWQQCTICVYLQSKRGVRVIMGSETVQNVGDDVIAIVKCVTDCRCFL
jgi:hypothetical protein